MTDTSALSERGNGAEVGTALAPRDRTGGLVQGQPTKAAAGSSVEDFFVIVLAGQGGSDTRGPIDWLWGIRAATLVLWGSQVSGCRGSICTRTEAIHEPKVVD